MASGKRRGAPLTREDRARHIAQRAAERAAERRAEDAKFRAAGLKKRRVAGADGRPVEVWSYRNSYGAMGFNALQVAAAERFGREWELAYRGLRGQGYEPGVDGGRSIHAAHLNQIEGQACLRAVKAALGERTWEYIVGVVVYGATAREIHRLGGEQHRVASDDIRKAFDDLAAYYNGRRVVDRTWRAMKNLIEERAAMIDKAEREAG